MRLRLPLRAVTFERAVLAAGAAVVWIGAVALFGWLVGSATLRGVWPSSDDVQPNAALGLVCAGAALILLVLAGPRLRAPALTLAAVAAALGLLALLEHALGLNEADRMGANTALCLAAAGAALLLLDVERGGVRLAQAGALVIVAVSVLAAIGHVFEVPQLQRGLAGDGAAAMGASATVAFLALATGILLARPDAGIMCLLRSSGPGGMLLRRVVLPACALAVLIGYARQEGERAGLYDGEQGTALFVIALILVLGAMLWLTARSLEMVHAERLEIVERERALLEASLDAVVTGDARGRLIELNPVAERMFGYRREEAIGHEAVELLVGPELRDFHRTALARAAADPTLPQSRRFETTAMRADGTPLPVEVVLARLRRPGAAMFVANLRDISERLEAQSAMRQLASIVESSRDGILAARLDGTVVAWNAAAERVYGYSAEEIISRAVGVLLPPGQEPPSPSMLELVQRGEDVPEHQAVHRRKDGALIDVAISGFPIRDVRGAVVAAGVIVRDITERKRADDALREQAALLDLSSDAVLVVDAETRRINSWSAGAARMYGFSAERAVGRVPAELLQTAWPEGPEAVERALRRHGVWEGELRHRTADGRELVVLSRHVLQRDAGGAPRAMLEINTDITERTRASERLRDSEERFRTLIAATPDPIVGVDGDGVIVFASPRVRDMLGYEPEELVGARIGKLVPDHVRDVHETHRRKFAAAPQTRPMGLGRELYARRKNGSEVPVEISLGVATTEAGSFTTALMVDITKRKQLEDQLRQAQKLEAVGQLAGGIAHDFNNLLTVISGYGSMARERVDGGPGAEELDEIARATERAGRLTGQLLAFSRRQLLKPEVLDLNEVVGALVPMLGRLIGEDVRIATLEQALLPKVLADRGQLEQVVLNLAVNARDAMPTGGTLTMETRAVVVDEESAREHLDVEPGHYVCLVVSDTGVGMEPEVAAHCLEPFFTTKDVGQGTGLGLATVHGIVTQSGGHLGVYSEPGIGTTFKIYLVPAELAGAAAAGPAEAEPLELGGSETILLCEDEDAVRRLVERILRREGYTVLAATHPSQALELAATHAGAIELLISDVIMPEMPGPELAERLQAHRRGVRTIFVSGYTAETLRDRGNLPLGSAFVEKPFQAAVLLRAVREVLDHARLPAGAS